MFEDNRSGKIVLVAHCILNQNSRVLGLAERSSAITEIVDFLIRKDLSVIQLPCPELAYAGISRPPQTREQYDTVAFRKYCRKIAEGIAKQIQEYEKCGIRLKLVIGVAGSPSCNVSDNQNTENSGIFMEELHHALSKRGISVPFYEIRYDRLPENLTELEKIVRD
ncbi:MAG: 2-thiouracil desulfurase family protein [Candidatus Bathyarchaeia archaeon]